MGDFVLALVRFASEVARLVESTALLCVQICRNPSKRSSVTGSKHDDGTQSDSENGLGLRFGSKRHAALEERLRAAGVGQVKTEGSSSVSRTAFMIEFYDEDNHCKRRSYSFSQNAPLLGGVAGERFCPAPPPRPKVVAMAADGSKGMSSSLAAVAPTGCSTPAQAEIWGAKGGAEPCPYRSAQSHRRGSETRRRPERQGNLHHRTG